MSVRNRGDPRRHQLPTRRVHKQSAAQRAAGRRQRVKRARMAGVVVTAVVAAVVGVLLIAHGGGGGAGAGTTSTNPTAFDLPRLNGDGDVRLASFLGKPTVVNFFASWCTACQGELPGFAEVSRELVGKVNFIGVNSLETGDGMAMARQFGIDWWPIARDVEGTQASGLHDALGGLGMPISAFYDAHGKLLYVSPGALPEPTLRGTLQKYFGVS